MLNLVSTRKFKIQVGKRTIFISIELYLK